VYLRSTALVAAAFGALAGLVAAGTFTRLDQWAVDRLMVAGDFHHAPYPAWRSAVPLLGARWDSVLGSVADIVTLPASPLIALAILAWLRRLDLVVVWVLADAVEFLCKHALTRPWLYDGDYHIRSFDTSFPSGHALRTVLLAAAVAAAYPRARALVYAWAAASIVLLLVAGWHTPTDLAGGVLLALLGLLGARGARALRARGLRAGARAA
jgi:membrane-associated phospholipid phosphatase